jgi:hypothetical protein
MKTCPVCGLVLDESYLFCPEDGSSLGNSDARQPQAEAAAPVTEEKSGAVVLYCPACAAEYPLTFSVCPVHAVPLTKHKIPAFVAAPASPARDEKAPSAQPQIADEEVGEDGNNEVVSREPAQPIQPDLSRESDYETAQAAAPAPAPPPRRRFRFRPSAEAEAYPLTVASRQEPGPGPVEGLAQAEYLSDGSAGDSLSSNASGEASANGRGLRKAAVAVATFLFLLGILGLTSLYRSINRRPGPPAAKTASQSNDAAQQPAVVYTPQAALDYKEEKPQPEKQVAESPAEDRRAGKDNLRDVAAVASTVAPRRESLAQQRPVETFKEQAPPARPVFAPKPSPASELVLPRGTFGQVEARLVQVRSRKTPGGVRYDLTFNMQEHAGRTTQWERLAVMTRSASGVSQSQTMPFYHRLGATGTLMFTVSVEMQGRARPDWQGRIICTSIGTDQTGRAYRASFGANVAPN